MADLTTEGASSAFPRQLVKAGKAAVIAASLALCSACGDAQDAGLAPAVAGERPGAATGGFTVAKPPAFDFTRDEARARFGRLATLNPWQAVADIDCYVATGDRLSLRVCETYGRVTTLAAMSRGEAGARMTRALVEAATWLAAPDAGPGDIMRAADEAEVALKKGGGVICPTIRCFRVTPLGDQVILLLDAAEA